MILLPFCQRSRPQAIRGGGVESTGGEGAGKVGWGEGWEGWEGEAGERRSSLHTAGESADLARATRSNVPLFITEPSYYPVSRC